MENVLENQFQTQQEEEANRDRGDRRSCAGEVQGVLQMAENRAGFSAVYDKKIQDLQPKLARQRMSVASAIQEIKDTRVEGMTGRVTNTGDVEESLGSFQLKCTSDCKV